MPSYIDDNNILHYSVPYTGSINLNERKKVLVPRSDGSTSCGWLLENNDHSYYAPRGWVVIVLEEKSSEEGKIRIKRLPFNEVKVFVEENN